MANLYGPLFDVLPGGVSSGEFMGRELINSSTSQRQCSMPLPPPQDTHINLMMSPPVLYSTTPLSLHLSPVHIIVYLITIIPTTRGNEMPSPSCSQSYASGPTMSTIPALAYRYNIHVLFCSPGIYSPSFLKMLSYIILSLSRSASLR